MSAEVEEWRAVPGYEGIYEVSDHGRVRSLDRLAPMQRGSDVMRRHHGRLLTGSLDRHGYPSIDARDADGNRRLLRVHQLVLRAFVGPPGVGQECCHGNGKRNDNRLSNLRWGTRRENMQDAVRHGTMGKAGGRRTPQAVAA